MCNTVVLLIQTAATWFRFHRSVVIIGRPNRIFPSFFYHRPNRRPRPKMNTHRPLGNFNADFNNCIAHTSRRRDNKRPRLVRRFSKRLKIDSMFSHITITVKNSRYFLNLSDFPLPTASARRGSVCSRRPRAKGYFAPRPSPTCRRRVRAENRPRPRDLFHTRNVAAFFLAKW